MNDYSSLVPRLRVPLADLQQLPACAKLDARLHELASYVGDFDAAIQLFGETRPVAKESPKHRRWMFIAARDGAVTLFNFDKALQTLGQLLRSCPALWAHAPPKPFKDARKIFDTAFPTVGDSRHAVAHAAEFVHKHGDHAVKGDVDVGKHIRVESPGSVGVSLYVSGSLFDDQFTSTVDGKLVSYHINAASLASLVATLEAACKTVRTAKEGYAAASTSQTTDGEKK